MCEWMLKWTGVILYTPSTGFDQKMSSFYQCPVLTLTKSSEGVDQEREMSAASTDWEWLLKCLEMAEMNKLTVLVDCRTTGQRNGLVLYTGGM